MTLFGWTDEEPLPIATVVADSDGRAARRVQERLDSIDPMRCLRAKLCLCIRAQENAGVGGHTCVS